MLNLVEKFTPEAVEATDEDGVVAIEYVVIAGLVAAGVAVVFATGLWTADEHGSHEPVLSTYSSSGRAAQAARP